MGREVRKIPREFMVVVSGMSPGKNGNHNDEQSGDERGAAGIYHGGLGRLKQLACQMSSTSEKLFR